MLFYAFDNKVSIVSIAAEQFSSQFQWTNNGSKCIALMNDLLTTSFLQSFQYREFARLDKKKKESVPLLAGQLEIIISHWLDADVGAI